MGQLRRLFKGIFTGKEHSILNSSNPHTTGQMFPSRLGRTRLVSARNGWGRGMAKYGEESRQRAIARRKGLMEMDPEITAKLDAEPTFTEQLSVKGRKNRGKTFVDMISDFIDWLLGRPRNRLGMRFSH